MSKCSDYHLPSFASHVRKKLGTILLIKLNIVIMLKAFQNSLAIKHYKVYTFAQSSTYQLKLTICLAGIIKPLRDLKTLNNDLTLFYILYSTPMILKVVKVDPVGSRGDLAGL